MVKRRDFGPVAGQMREALEKYSREELADLLTHIVRVYVIEGKEPTLSDTGKVSSDDNLRTLTFAQLVLHLQMNLPHPELQSFRVSGDRVWAERNGNEVLIAGEPPTDENPPDWEDLAPRTPPRTIPTERSRPPGVRAATGPVSPLHDPLEAPPSVGTPRQRRREAESTPGAVAREAAALERPNVGLREEEENQAPETGLPGDWFQDTPTPLPQRGGVTVKAKGKGKGKGKGEGAEDEVAEKSDRFSMLELD